MSSGSRLTEFLDIALYFQGKAQDGASAAPGAERQGGPEERVSTGAPVTSSSPGSPGAKAGSSTQKAKTTAARQVRID